MTVGALDGVPGLGPKRRGRLVEQFGGLAGLRNASREELLGVSWLPATVGAAVFERLHTPMPVQTGAARHVGERRSAEGVP
jgi:excinuclease ABC subunit C